ncbi:unnamed protein product, partial [marine sediment metagenome]
EITRLCYVISNRSIFEPKKQGKSYLDRIADIETKLVKYEENACISQHFLLLANIHYLKGRCHLMQSRLYQSICLKGNSSKLAPHAEKQAVKDFHDSIQRYHTLGTGNTRRAVLDELASLMNQIKIDDNKLGSTVIRTNL